MSVRIIVDSTTDLPEQTARRVTVVPLTIHFGEQQYVSGVDIDARKFYEMLVEGDVLPTTSQPTPYAFTQVFQEAVDAGDTVVCITVSSKLSGTYQSACIAAADFPGKVFVVDSLTVAIGGGILTEYALSLTDKGMDAEEIAWKLMQKREKVRLLALLDTLEYLKKGGRVTPAGAALASALNIKPVLTIQGEKLDSYAKARGMKKALKRMIEALDDEIHHRFADASPQELPIGIAGTMLSEEKIENLIKTVQSAFPDHSVHYEPLSISIGCHIGPQAFGLSVTRI